MNIYFNFKLMKVRQEDIREYIINNIDFTIQEIIEQLYTIYDELNENEKYVIQKSATFLYNEIKEKEVTYFCSDLRLDTLPSVLSENGITVNEVEAYKTMYSPTKVADKINGVLFYSPSTVESYMKENAANKIAFCIGESTAKEARKHFENVQVAKLPTVESVIELVNLHFVKE